MALSGDFNTVPLRETSSDIESLARGFAYSVPNATLWNNIEERRPDFGRHMNRDVYVARTVAMDEVVMGRLPAMARLSGRNFSVFADGAWVSEQFFPPELNPEDLAFSDYPDDAFEVCEEEYLLAARYGIGTWGHWLGELLPKCVLVERKFPKRFKYVVPVDVVGAPDGENIWCRIRESFAAYGIPRDRLFPVYREKSYMFSRLYAVSSVWTRHLIHPEATAAMREGLGLEVAPEDLRKTYIVRDPAFGRALSNAIEVAAIVDSFGYRPHRVPGLGFMDQARLFAGSSHIVSILGSDLTGLIFAPAGVKVVTLSPDVFGDRFFYALTVDRAGTFVDLRGGVMTERRPVHKSEFHIEADMLAFALRLVEGAGLPEAWREEGDVARMMPVSRFDDPPFLPPHLDEVPEGFDAARYLELNPDVAAAKMDAVDHYIKYGRFEKRRWT